MARKWEDSSLKYMLSGTHNKKEMKILATTLAPIREPLNYALIAVIVVGDVRSDSKPRCVTDSSS